MRPFRAYPPVNVSFRHGTIGGDITALAGLTELSMPHRSADGPHGSIQVGLEHRADGFVAGVGDTSVDADAALATTLSSHPRG